MPFIRSADSVQYPHHPGAAAGSSIGLLDIGKGALREMLVKQPFRWADKGMAETLPLSFPVMAVDTKFYQYRQI